MRSHFKSRFCRFSAKIALILATYLFITAVHAEALENVNPANLKAQCDEWLRDHNVVGVSARNGHCDEMKELNQSVEGVEDARRAKITRLVEEACSSKDIDAWFAAYAKQCMGAK